MEALAQTGKAPQRRSDVDLCLLSANALTADGRIVNIDGNGNRVAASVGGPKKVMYVIGRNKIVEGGIDDAIARIKRCACPPNCRRLGKQTPCALTGKCADCDSPDRICKVTVVFDRRPTGIAAESEIVKGKGDAWVLTVPEGIPSRCLFISSGDHAGAFPVTAISGATDKCSTFVTASMAASDVPGAK